MVLEPNTKRRRISKRSTPIEPSQINTTHSTTSDQERIISETNTSHNSDLHEERTFKDQTSEKKKTEIKERAVAFVSKYSTTYNNNEKGATKKGSWLVQPLRTIVNATERTMLSHTHTFKFVNSK